eukprot:TRINITY_DN36640_c0_g1_i1.p1 TRINITY_DN36640_c0_g1~~TRINITY_DN36640_c0_g1_i1.p1  ORF type:complete len:913 (-),score=324.00 TRINITY_DN36640_c0_g1_i1:166-2904(-)
MCIRDRPSSSPFALEANQVVDTYARKKWPFDNVIPMGVSQEQVYNDCARDYVKDLMDGYNVTIFAYGTTGSGKTYTMAGEDDAPGIIPRMTADIFRAIDTYGIDRADTDPGAINRRIEVVCSYYEIYNENVNDLIDPHNRNVTVRLVKIGRSSQVLIEPLTRMKFTTPAAINEFISRGNQNRRVTATKMNPNSSRSHSVFQLQLNVFEADGTLVSSPMLILADLAGCEDPRQSGVSGNALNEAININLSLGGIAACIKALTTGAPYVPYRNYKITTVLKNALGGDSKVSLIVACNPHPDNHSFTVRALQFATQCKKVKNKAKKKVVKSVAALEAEVAKLEAEIVALRSLSSQWEQHHKQAHPDCGFTPNAELVVAEDEDEEASETDAEEKLDNLETYMEHTEEEMNHLRAQLEEMQDGPDRVEIEMEIERKQGELQELQAAHEEQKVKASSPDRDRGDDLRGSIKVGATTDMVHTISDLKAQLEQAQNQLESKVGLLGAAESKIQELEENKEYVDRKCSNMKRTYEALVTRQIDEKDQQLKATRSKLDQAEQALDHHQAAALVLETQLRDVRHELADSQSRVLDGQQQVATADHNREEYKRKLQAVKLLVEENQEAHEAAIHAAEAEHLDELTQFRAQVEAEKTEIQAVLEGEIDQLKTSMAIIQADSSQAAHEQQAAVEREIASLKQELIKSDKSIQEWHFVAVTYKSQLRSARTKISTLEGKLTAVTQEAEKNQEQCAGTENALRNELHQREHDLQHLEQHEKRDEEELALLRKQLAERLTELEAAVADKQHAEENILAFKNQAFMEKTMREDLESSLGGVDVFQRAIRCNELEMELGRLGRLNWILDYQLRSATHGIVVDVTTYEPRALLSGWVKRKGTFRWSNKYYKTEYNADTKTCLLYTSPSPRDS